MGSSTECALIVQNADSAEWVLVQNVFFLQTVKMCSLPTTTNGCAIGCATACAIGCATACAIGCATACATACVLCAQSHRIRSQYLQNERYRMCSLSLSQAQRSVEKAGGMPRGWRRELPHPGSAVLSTTERDGTNLTNDGTELRLKAHVQHAVGLVQDQVRHAPQVCYPHFQVV